MAELTITEALAEIKTISKRLDKKREFVQQHLFRQEFVKDPLERDGGSIAALQRELQAIRDLEERLVAIRLAIQAANTATTVEILGEQRTIAEWLVWRREVYPGQAAFLDRLIMQLRDVRQQAIKKGLSVVTTSDVATTPNDIVVNLSELELQKAVERLAEMAGQLDGMLSLKNATTFVDL